MMTNYGQELRRFSLNLLYNGNAYWIERLAEMEDALADGPKNLQLELVGDGELSADWALTFREALRQRSPDTKLITNARSGLQNGAVLLWLLGDRRQIRPDGRIFFRRANYTEPLAVPEKIWDGDVMEYVDSLSEADPEEADHAKVLHYINEFLPVRELVGRIVDVPTLRQFGLVENDRFDALLTSAFQPAAGAKPAMNSQTTERREIDRSSAS